ncbi:MAG TPA: glycosyltransferase family 2 protein [Candidatus Saccharimonadales bacterium]|nr:glycosyltransferase family 2 protein [Candidatus Saccharimonadales bacterium]
MLNKTQTLTLVIPAYNEEGYLQACLDSVAEQTVMPDEVIVINNNSTDETAKIAKEYSFVTLIDEPKQGVFFASKTGFNTAESDLIGRIDADTILPDDWIEKILDYFKRADIAAITGPVDYYDMPFPRTNHFFDHSLRLFAYRWIQETPFLYGSNYAIRRTVWQAVESELCPQSDIHEDVDLAIHLVRSGQKILYTKDILSNASARRYNSSFKAFMGYIRMGQRVYNRHGMKTIAITLGTVMWLLGYVLIHPWRNVWYRHYESVSRLGPVVRQPRKNPMSGSIEI